MSTVLWLGRDHYGYLHGYMRCLPSRRPACPVPVCVCARARTYAHVPVLTGVEIDKEQHLLNEIKRNNCVIFVGAGFSAPAQLPTWEVLLQTVGKEAKAKVPIPPDPAPCPSPAHALPRPQERGSA